MAKKRHNYCIIIPLPHTLTRLAAGLGGDVLLALVRFRPKNRFSRCRYCGIKQVAYYHFPARMSICHFLFRPPKIRIIMGYISSLPRSISRDRINLEKPEKTA